MPISLKDFDDAHAVAHGKLVDRISGFLQREDQAHSASEVAASLLGISNRYHRLLSAEVDEAVPVVKGVLDMLVSEGRLRSVSRHSGLLGAQTYYAKPLVSG